MPKLIALILLLGILLTACGKEPRCPIAPAIANDCTPEFRYGALCETQPFYTVQGIQYESAKFEGFCSKLLRR